MAAIFAGLVLAHRAWGAAVRGLLVYTDCQAAIHFLTGKELKARTLARAPGVVRLREKVLGFSGEHGIELDVRWVKGHQRTNTVRAYLNARCDALAGAARTVAESEREARRREAEIARPQAPAPTIGPEKRSRAQKNRERRRRARARARAKKAAARDARVDAQKV